MSVLARHPCYRDSTTRSNKRQEPILWEPVLGRCLLGDLVTCNTVNSLIANTSHKRPTLVSNHFVNNRFVSYSNAVSKTLL